jgi:hypothetical protein
LGLIPALSGRVLYFKALGPTRHKENKMAYRKIVPGMLAMVLVFVFALGGCGDDSGGGSGSSISANSIVGSRWSAVETLNDPAFDISGVRVKRIISFTNSSHGTLSSEIISWGNVPPGYLREMLQDEILVTADFVYTYAGFHGSLIVLNESASFTVDAATNTLTLAGSAVLHLE